MVERVSIMGLWHTAVFSMEFYVWDPGKALLNGLGGVLYLLLTKLEVRSGNRRFFFHCTFKSLAYQGPIGIYGSIKIFTKAYLDSSGENFLTVLGRSILKTPAYKGPIGIYGSALIVTKAYSDSSAAMLLTVFGHQTFKAF